MTLLFFDIEGESWDAPAGTLLDDTDPLYHDATYSRTSKYPLLEARVATPSLTYGDSLWVHADLGFILTGSSADYQFLYGEDSLGNHLFRCAPMDGYWSFEYWDGSTFVRQHGGAAVGSPRHHIYDVQYKNTVDGRIAFYLDDVLQFEVLGDFSALADVDKIVFSDELNTSDQRGRISQVIVTSDERTVGWRLKTAPATGNGFHTDWVGDYTDINKTDNTIATYIESATAEEIELFTRAGFVVPTNFSVRAVVVGIMAGDFDGVPPDNLQAVIRFGSTDYESVSVQPVADDFRGGYVAVWEDNPATLLPWTNSDASSGTIEFGVVSKT